MESSQPSSGRMVSSWPRTSAAGISNHACKLFPAVSTIARNVANCSVHLKTAHTWFLSSVSDSKTKYRRVRTSVSRREWVSGLNAFGQVRMPGH